MVNLQKVCATWAVALVFASMGACGGSHTPESVCRNVRDGACSACAALTTSCPDEAEIIGADTSETQ